jgi:hypothetical protein
VNTFFLLWFVFFLNFQKQKSTQTFFELTIVFFRFIGAKCLMSMAFSARDILSFFFVVVDALITIGSGRIG